MTAHDYLVNILRREELLPAEILALQTARDDIERVLRGAYGYGPRIYYGGSYAKDTQIRSAYDLDIVMYLPSHDALPLRDLFEGVQSYLARAQFVVAPKTVALRLPYKQGFHVDVVPGRARDGTFKYASLYRNPGSWMQTSLKVHIDAIRKSGIRPIVRLLKLWRVQKNVPLTTFSIEIIAVAALHGHAIVDYSIALAKVFTYLSANIGTVRLIDPASSSNEVEVSYSDRLTTSQRASEAVQAQYWSQIVA